MSVVLTVLNLRNDKLSSTPLSKFMMTRTTEYQTLSASSVTANNLRSSNHGVTVLVRNVATRRDGFMTIWAAHQFNPLCHLTLRWGHGYRDSALLASNAATGKDHLKGIPMKSTRSLPRTTGSTPHWLLGIPYSSFYTGKGL